MFAIIIDYWDWFEQILTTELDQMIRKFKIVLNKEENFVLYLLLYNSFYILIHLQRLEINEWTDKLKWQISIKPKFCSRLYGRMCRSKFWLCSKICSYFTRWLSIFLLLNRISNNAARPELLSIKILRILTKMLIDFSSAWL